MFTYTKRHKRGKFVDVIQVTRKPWKPEYEYVPPVSATFVKSRRRQIKAAREFVREMRKQGKSVRASDFFRAYIDKAPSRLNPNKGFTYKGVQNILKNFGTAIYNVRISRTYYPGEAHESTYTTIGWSDSTLRKAIDLARQQVRALVKDARLRRRSVDNLTFSPRYRVIRNNVPPDVWDRVSEFFTLTGGVRREAGEIMKIKNATKIAKMFRSVLPRDATGAIGVEIECYVKVSRDELAADLLPFEGRVSIVGDGSLSEPPTDGHYAVEVRVCDHETRIHDTIRDVCKVLKKYDARVNGTCGLHVHLDMRGRDWRVAYTRLAKTQSALLRLVPPSRRNNHYCRKVSISEPDMSDRYKIVNATSVSKHKTLEIRLHSGSVIASKISAWINLVWNISHASTLDNLKYVASPERLYKILVNMPDVERSYWRSREAKFNTDVVDETGVNTAPHEEVERATDDDVAAA